MTNGDRLCPFLTTVALHWIGAMTGGVDADIRADETVIANGDTGFIEDGEVCLLIAWTIILLYRIGEIAVDNSVLQP